MYQVVVVDDDADYRLVVTLALAGHPYLTLAGEAGNVDDAVELLDRARPDFVLLDLGLSGADGRSLLSALRTASPDSSIIATSTSPEEGGGLFLSTGRVLGHISKGVAPARLGVEILLLAELIDALDTALDVAATRLPREPSSAAAARRFVEQTLSRWQCDEVVDTVKLLVSELVGNAIGHAHSEVEVIVHLLPDRLRIDVVDDDPEGPRRRAVSDADIGGRGIAVVEAMAEAWGVSRRGPGKVVWFELSRPGESTDGAPVEEPSGEESPVGT